MAAADGVLYRPKKFHRHTLGWKQACIPYSGQGIYMAYVQLPQRRRGLGRYFPMTRTSVWLCGFVCTKNTCTPHSKKNWKKERPKLL